MYLGDVDGTGSESCSVAGFDISGVETRGSATRRLVKFSRLDNRGSRVRFPVRAGNFSLHHRVQTVSGGPRSLLFNGYQGFFPWG
jgi:hypothetical protein